MFCMSSVSIVAMPPAVFRRRINELVNIHIRAMGYPDSIASQRRTLWLSNVNHADFICHVAMLHPEPEEPDVFNPNHRCIGICFSFRGGKETWWNQQVARGLLEAGHSPLQIASTLRDYAELSEVHVLPEFQKAGLGRELFTHHLPHVHQQHIMLSTPEVPGESNGAWRLYRSLGFQDVLRNFHFPADSRPFAILSKAL